LFEKNRRTETPRRRAGIPKGRVMVTGLHGVNWKTRNSRPPVHHERPLTETAEWRHIAKTDRA